METNNVRRKFAFLLAVIGILLSSASLFTSSLSRLPGICGAEQFGNRLVWGRWSSETSVPNDLVNKAPCP
jgi:hypothetical protein